MASCLHSLIQEVHPQQSLTCRIKALFSLSFLIRFPGQASIHLPHPCLLYTSLTKYGFTAAFGGGRRDEEKSRAKERIFSFRNAAQAWDPKNQRPEMWKLYNTKIQKGESMRVFPISNWTEKDIWQYIQRENIEMVPLYVAKERPGIYRDGNIIMVDDDRLKLRPDEKIEYKKVRFRTLGSVSYTHLNYLYSDEAQEIEAENYFRPTNEKILKEHSDVFDLSVDLVNISEYGGWDEVQKKHFGDGGIFDEIYER